MRFVQLSDVCDLQNGFAFKSTDYVEKSNTCNIRMSNIRPGGSFNEFHNERYLPDSYAKEYKDYLLNDGDLIIAMTDMATETKILGLPTLVNNTSGRSFLLNQRVGKLCKFSKDIYVPYLRHILTAQDVIDYYKSKGAGGLQINISKKDILSVKFPLPAIPTQQKIVAKLDAIFAEIDTATAAAEANAKNTEALFQSYLTEVFERGGEGWKTLTIKDLIKIRSGDFLPAKNMKVDGVIDVYGGNGISGKHNLHNISGENIVIGRVGAKCGNVRLVNGDIWITDNAFYVSEYKIKLNKEFLALALKQKKLRELAHQMAQPVISFATIKDAEIKIPDSISTQIKLLEVKNFLESQIEIAYTANVKKVKLFKLLKQSTLQRAFSGELVKD